MSPRTIAPMLAMVPALCLADGWTGRDKDRHALAGAAIATATAAATGSDRAGLAAGIVAGVGKELADMRGRGHTASWKDAAVTVAGAGLALHVRGLVLMPTGASYRVEW